ncbi:hypothetical protein Tco_1049160 [Tanacetum coccineum]
MYKNDTANDAGETPRRRLQSKCNRELLQGKATKASNTNSFNTVSTPVNAASAPRTSNDDGPSFFPFGGSFPLNVNDLPDDPLMPDLEDTVEEPIKITQALDDESWVETMQEELLQFKIQKLLTARKRVGPLPARRLAWRHASPCSSDHHPSSSSSSSDSFPVHSLGLDAPDQAHYGSSTRDSSSGDSSERPLHSSSHSARPSRKRSRSPIDFVPSSMPVMGSLAPTHADLLSPRKRFRDSYSFEANIEQDTKIDPIETEVHMELGIGDGDDVRDHVEIDPRDVRDDTKGDGIVRSFKDMPIDLNDVVHDFYHHMSKVRIDRIVGIEIIQRRLEADQLIARGQRVSMIEMIDSLRLENLKVRAMLDIERDRVNSLRLHMSLS